MLDGLGVSGPLRELVGAQGDGEVPLALRDTVMEIAGRLGADFCWQYLSKRLLIPLTGEFEIKAPLGALTLNAFGR